MAWSRWNTLSRRTFGAMSVGARGPFNAAYDQLLFDVHRCPFPGHGREGM